MRSVHKLVIMVNKNLRVDINRCPLNPRMNYQLPPSVTIRPAAHFAAYCKLLLYDFNVKFENYL